MRRLLCIPLLLSAAAACTNPGDEGYTALMRYAVTDFRVAGISAELVDSPDGGNAMVEGARVRLRALILKATDDPVELEWLDCPSFAWAESDPASGTVDCLGSPREIRLGRGEETIYTVRTDGWVPMSRDGSWPMDAAGMPIVPDGGWPEPDAAERQAVERDDGIVYLRATQGDQVRYGRKNFLGLFNFDPTLPNIPPPTIEALTVNGGGRGVDDRSHLEYTPGAELEVRFDVVGAEENVAVQWFVTAGTLSRRGLTYYVEVDRRQQGGLSVPVSTAQNTWRLPDATGPQELIAVVGGSFGPLPYLRIPVEVRR